MPPRQYLNLRPFKTALHYQGAYGTTQPGTKNFDHLLPLSRHLLRAFNRHVRAYRWHNKLPKLPQLRIPEARDRIKCWNIVPGDKVRLRTTDDPEKIWDVAGIDRVLNQVLLKDTNPNAQNLLVSHHMLKDEMDTSGGHKPVKYSECQLYLGEFEVPPDAQHFMARKVPVFAKRIRRRSIKFDRRRLEFTWRRVANATTPLIPGMKLPKWIPWPARQAPFVPSPSPLDTPADVVMKVTYKPPHFPHNLFGPLPKRPLKADFIQYTMNPHLPRKYGEGAPVEIHLVDELSNPHSRAKKIERWHRALAGRKQLLRTIISKHAKTYGLPQKEARAQAIVEWKDIIAQQTRSKRVTRWKIRAQQDNLARKRRRKAKKEARKERHLRDLVLVAGKNQYIPPSVRLTN